MLHTDGYPLDLTLVRESRVKAQSAIEQELTQTYGVELWADAFNSVEGGKDFRRMSVRRHGGDHRNLCLRRPVEFLV